MSFHYKAMIINYLSQSLCLHLYLIGGVIPIFILPCVAGYSGGLFGALGIPISWQYIGTMWFMASYAGSMAAPFYYRCDIILPHSHVLNHRYIRYFGYSLMLIYPSIITPPVWIISLATTNVTAVKEEMASKCSNQTDLLYDSGTLAFNFLSGSNPFQIFTFAILLLALSTCIVAITLFCTWSLYYLGKKRGLMSERTRHMHKKYVFSLIYQVSAAQFFFCIPIAVACALAVTSSGYADLIHFCLFCLGISSPAGTVTMIVSCEPYKQFLEIYNSLHDMWQGQVERTNEQFLQDYYGFRLDLQ